MKKFFTKKYLRYALLFAFMILLVVLLKKLFLVVGLIIVGGVSQFYKRFLPVQIGFELMIFSTVAIGFLTNPFIAWFSALVMIVINVIVAGDYGMLPLFRVAMYSAICLLLPFTMGYGIFVSGVISCIAANLVYLVLTYFVYPQFFKFVYANFLNIVFNIAIFRWAAGFGYL